MDVCRTISECRAACRPYPSLGFVPTMGALHRGHLSLVERAKARCGSVAVSIFVNPTQFGPREDFGRYPRPLERDLELCRAANVDVVFTPSPEEMYPPGLPQATIDLPRLTTSLEGALRPGHFAGVCTVVAKLLHIVSPRAAFFGEKDFQQLAVISAMVDALNLDTLIVGCPTLRDPDGLAMSSRNQYLTASERTRGLAIHRALEAASRAASAGERNCASLKTLMRDKLLDSHGAEGVPIDLQYATVVDPHTLEEIRELSGEARALVAMKVGSTRLIDNMALVPPGTAREETHAA